jgi:two-component system CheB/CheR fusion protein
MFLSPFVPPKTAVSAALPKPACLAFPEKLPLQELTEKALLQNTPAAVLVNKQGDIFYLHGRTGMYLEPTPGEIGTANILKMAREGLRQELTTALHKAVFGKETIRCPGLRVKTNGDFTGVDLTVQQVKSSSVAPLYLVILETAALPEVAAAVTPGSAAEPGTAADLIIAGLKNELRAKEEYLQTTHEQLETSCEELKSANEEMQSVNEELQSTNEEMETSKEELQSVNEELATVNNELQTKVADLSLVNDDMNNLLAGTGIATVFVDHSLHILRFTPAANKIINLIPSDLGRPVGHIVSNLVGYDSLVADAQTVLDTLIAKEVEVQATSGMWYSLRIQPYRTIRNIIEGAVITFMDITEMVQTKERLHKANELNRLAIVVHDAHDAITVQDLAGRILAWNPGAVRMYGWSEAEALAMHVDARIPAGLRVAALAQIKQLSLSDILEPSSTQRLCKDGTVVTVWLTSTALMDEAGQMYAIATTERLQQPTMPGD